MLLNNQVMLGNIYKPDGIVPFFILSYLTVEKPRVWQKKESCRRAVRDTSNPLILSKNV